MLTLLVCCPSFLSVLTFTVVDRSLSSFDSDSQSTKTHSIDSSMTAGSAIANPSATATNVGAMDEKGTVEVIKMDNSQDPDIQFKLRVTIKGDANDIEFVLHGRTETPASVAAEMASVFNLPDYMKV